MIVEVIVSLFADATNKGDSKPSAMRSMIVPMSRHKILSDSCARLCRYLPDGPSTSSLESTLRNSISKDNERHILTVN